MNNKLPVEIVEEQLKYYNNHDIEGFVSTYSQNIELYNLGEKEPFLQGIAALRERYTQRFSNPKLYAHIANRMVLGNRVMDFEQVSGIKDGEISEVIAVYEIENDLIQKVYFIR